MTSECSICGKICRSKPALSFHMNTHETSDNIYKTMHRDVSPSMMHDASSIEHIYNIHTEEPEIEPKPQITSSKYGFCDVCGVKKEKWLLGKCGLWCNKILCTDCFLTHFKTCEKTEDYQEPQEDYRVSYQSPQPEPEPQEIYKEPDPEPEEEPEEQEELYECDLCEKSFKDIIECRDCEGLFCKRCFNYHECED